MLGEAASQTKCPRADREEGPSALLAAWQPVFAEGVLDGVFDVFRLRQYFDVVARIRDTVEGVCGDAGFLDDARRALVPLPFDVWPEPVSPFQSVEFPAPSKQPRVALLATGGAARSRRSSA